MAEPWWVNLLISVAAALAVAWLGLIVALLIARPRGASLTGALRILPDVIRLLRRLAADPALPRGVRIRLGLLLAYLACPIDIVPDFIPIIGYAGCSPDRRVVGSGVAVHQDVRKPTIFGRPGIFSTVFGSVRRSCDIAPRPPA